MILAELRYLLFFNVYNIYNFSNYDKDDIRCIIFLLLSTAYYYLINFFLLFCLFFFLISGSFRKNQYINFRVQNNAIALIDFATQISCSFFSDGYAARYLQVNFATKIE